MIKLDEKFKYKKIADSVIHLWTEAVTNTTSDTIFLLVVPCERSL